MSDVIYGVLADAVVAAHFAFVVFLVVGGVLAFRWPRALWFHVPSVVRGAFIVALLPTITDASPVGQLARWRPS